MNNKIVKARLGKAPIKLPPVAGKTPRTELIWLSKTKTTKRAKSGWSNKGKKILAAKQSEQISSKASNNSSKASNNSSKASNNSPKTDKDSINQIMIATYQKMEELSSKR